MPFFPKPIFQPELVVRDNLLMPVRSLSFRPSEVPPPYPFDVDMPLGVRSGRAEDALRPMLVGIADGGAGGDERPVPDDAAALLADRLDIIDDVMPLLLDSSGSLECCSSIGMLLVLVLSVPRVPSVVAVPCRCSGWRCAGSSLRLRIDQRFDLSPVVREIDGSLRRAGELCSMNAVAR